MPTRARRGRRSGPQGRRSFKKIYYGPPGDEKSLYWNVKVKDATRAVRINGTLAEALQGAAGVTIGCHLSNVARENADAFPHACLLGAFTKTMAYIAIKIRNGYVAEAVRYRHGYGQLVELNDTDHNRERIRANPDWANREFILHSPKEPAPYRPSARSLGGIDRTGRRTGERSKVWHGALKRARDAGLINVDLRFAQSPSTARRRNRHAT